MQKIEEKFWMDQKKENPNGMPENIFVSRFFKNASPPNAEYDEKSIDSQKMNEFFLVDVIDEHKAHPRNEKASTW